MADPILITCNDCGKQIKAPPTAAGKKIRCPKCKTILPVPDPLDVPAAPGEKKTFDFERETRDAKNPYDVTYETLAQRCPFCAQDIDPPDSRICLHCGYDLVERSRRPSKTVYERTAFDLLKWQLPAIGAIVGIAAVWVGFWYYHTQLPYKMLAEKDAKNLTAGRWNYFDDESADWTGVIFHWGIEVWFIVIGLFLSWRMGKFAFTRLFFHFLPPESEKRILK